MSQANIEIVRRGYELYGAGDLDGVAGLFSESAELAGAGGLGVADTAAGTRYGPEGFIRSTEEALEAFEDFRVAVEGFIDAGEAVVVSVRITGKGRASAAELETHLAHLWVLRDGKIIRGEVYRTTDEALGAAGASD